MSADLLQPGSEQAAARKSASHGEAGYERRARDAYFTPPWVTRALLRAARFNPPDTSRNNTLVWEPACGDGRMATEIAAQGYQLIASDIEAWGYGTCGVDFLDPSAGDFLGALEKGLGLVLAAIVTNPPFNLAVQFIQRALVLTRESQGKVAILQRHEFDAPVTNSALFRPPFAQKLILPRRPKWVDGARAARPRFPYAWYLWDWAHQGPPILRWLPDPDKPAGVALL